jgi:hypothetical protein
MELHRISTTKLEHYLEALVEQCLNLLKNI